MPDPHPGHSEAFDKAVEDYADDAYGRGREDALREVEEALRSGYDREGDRLNGSDAASFVRDRFGGGRP